jgi:hypothetical protein
MVQTLRVARRAEIESDLWEHLHADEGAAHPLELLGRLLLGVPDDLRWVLEQGGHPLGAARRVLVMMASAVGLMMTVWILALARTPEPPPIPVAPRITWHRAQVPPPPPPPPPLCNPVNPKAVSPCTRWP